MLDDRNIIVTEDSVHAETSAAQANLTSVITVLSRDGYFPKLCECSTFISTVVDRCEKDFTSANICSVAFQTAQDDQFIQLIRTGLFLHSDGTTSTDPEKISKKKNS